MLELMPLLSAAVAGGADAVAAGAAQGVPAISTDLKYLAYAGFVAMILVFLALDLGVFHKNAHEVSMKEALGWTTVWVTVALLFNVGVYFAYQSQFLGLGQNVPVLGEPGVTKTVGGWEAAKVFFTGYVVEKSLAMDNVFVIAVIFASLGIPGKYQHRVLFWGIVGAIIMRGLMIFIGAALIERFVWIIYVFGGFLILTALKMALIKSDHTDPANSFVVRLAKRHMKVTDRFDGQRFFTKIDGVRYATPLFLALLLVEFTDLIFAVDSIPAIFAITADPFIVFTSNILAILGLRSLYFCLAALITKFRFLKPALILVMAFIGVKMCLIKTDFKIPTDVSLYIVLGILGAGVLASWLLPPGKGGHAPTTLPPGGQRASEAEGVA